MKDIVIIGAGYAGILTAKKLAKKFKGKDDINITIIDKNPYHTMLTELHEAAAGRVDEDSIKISLKKVFAGRKVNVVLDSVTHVDFEGKKVEGRAGSYSYDYLVLAAGSKPTYFGVKGAPEHAHNLWSYEDAAALKTHIENAFRNAANLTDIEEKKRLLTFYVVGAGFTGVEMVGELAEYVPILCRKFEIERSLVSIFDVDVLPRTVNILPESISRKVEKRLAKMGVQVSLNTGVVELGRDFIDLKINDKIERRTAGTIIWTAGIESAGITLEAAKVLPSEGRGRISTDKFLRSKEREEVFVVGDNLFLIPAGEERPVPQMVENCEQSADTAAHNIKAAIEGGQMEEYKPASHGVMVCVGGRYGVARVGFPGKMVNLPSFLAMFVKHFINVVYFVQVLGWNKVVSYLRHEFFTIRNRRSFLGGHFSNRTPSFLLVPLRIWLGGVWAFEGVMKIMEGWLAEPKLEAFFAGANEWYNAIVGSQAGNGVEAVTSATAVAGAGGAQAIPVGVEIFNWHFFDLFSLLFVSGKEPSVAAISDYAMKIDIPLMNWFLDKFVLSGDSMQIFMQCAIVAAEILIGLALMGGLFNFLSAGASLVLQLMFLATTGLFLSTFWMIFAAIAILIGGGSTFGLDYYVIPVLKDKWSRNKLARKWYLYND